jgi:hypothetical protein
MYLVIKQLQVVAKCVQMKSHCQLDLSVKLLNKFRRLVVNTTCYCPTTASMSHACARVTIETFHEQELFNNSLPTTTFLRPSF